MYINKIVLLCLLVLPLMSEDSFQTKFNYFGNISASALSNSGYDLNNYNHDSVDDSFSLNPYTKFGAQVSISQNDFTFTAQGLVRNIHGSLEADFTWLNIKYDVNDNYAIRLGRIQTKVLLHSESINLDYLHLWSKPPSEVYRLMPVGTFDGLELTYNKTLGEYNFNASLVLFGSFSDDIYPTQTIESTLKVDHSRSICFTLENDEMLYKVSYSRTNTNVEDDASTKKIVQGLEAYSNDMDRYTYEDRRGDVFSLGLQYRGESFIIDTEIAHFESTSLFPSSTGAYALVGYKMNKFTPFIMYAENENDEGHFDTSAINTPDATSTALKRGLDDVMYLSNFSQKTASLGMRYDLDVGLALKAQVDRITTSNYGDISSSSVNSSGLERLGILSRDTGTQDEAIYAFTFSLSFAY